MILKIQSDGKGYGKPVNPFSKVNPGWYKFNDANPTLPIYLPNGNPYLGDDVVEGERAWQYSHPFNRPLRWKFEEDGERGHEESYAAGYETREVYRVHPVVTQSDKNLTEQEKLNQPKELVIDRQFKNNCDYGFKQTNVNRFIRMAFESGFENGMNYQKYGEFVHPVVTEQAEAKTGIWLPFEGWEYVNVEASRLVAKFEDGSAMMCNQDNWPKLIVTHILILPL